MDLYRGKEKEKGYWIIGAAICIGDKAYILGSENLFPERPAYRSMAIGAGLEDQEITDRYEAAAYGWTEALDRYEENFPNWIEVIPETVTKCTDRHDIKGNVLFEGDIFQNKKHEVFEICYGRYLIKPPKHAVYDNTGFFVVTDDESDVDIGIVRTLGTPEIEAYLIGNIFDNPELSPCSGQ